MENLSKVILCCLAALCVSGLAGCGSKADENKPMSEVKAEAEKMSVGELRNMAVAYKNLILAKQTDVDKLADRLKSTPLKEKLSEESQKLVAEIDKISKSLSALKERFKVYFDKLKEKGGDVSGLEF